MSAVILQFPQPELVPSDADVDKLARNALMSCYPEYTEAQLQTHMHAKRDQLEKLKASVQALVPAKRRAKK